MLLAEPDRVELGLYCTSHWAVHFVESLTVGHSKHSINAQNEWMNGPRVKLSSLNSKPSLLKLLCAAGVLCNRVSPLPSARGCWRETEAARKGLAPSCLLADPWECHLVMAYQPGSRSWFQCSALFCTFPESAEAQFWGALSSCDDCTSGAVTPSLVVCISVPYDSSFKLLDSNSANLCPLLFHPLG